MFAGEHFCGSAEAGGDFVGDEEDIEFFAEVGDGAEEAGGLDEHAGGALDDGLDADGGDLG